MSPTFKSEHTATSLSSGVTSVTAPCFLRWRLAVLSLPLLLGNSATLFETPASFSFLNRFNDSLALLLINTVSCTNEFMDVCVVNTAGYPSIRRSNGELISDNYLPTILGRQIAKLCREKNGRKKNE